MSDRTRQGTCLGVKSVRDKSIPLRPSQVGAFAYVISSAADEDCIVVCIDLVLQIGWVDSRKFFYAFSKTLTGVANAVLHTLILVPGYGGITKIPKTSPGPPHTLDSLTHIYFYIDDVITVVQGGA